ncbi:hypothetical protein [Paenibacillus sp. FSL R10-2734]|uniref:hypothetical protein n=1 Tax=Paenibacillus sp. FSL R10-2734 TaxID=2954691 RepID=UPI0030DC6FFE
MGHIDAPKIIHLQMIDPHRLEIYWDQEVVHANQAECFHLTIDDTLIETVQDDSAEWDVRPIYERVKKRTTLYIQHPVSKQALGKLKVSISGHINNSLGLCADQDKSYVVNYWQDFYSCHTNTSSGILIKSSFHVSREAHRKAAQIIDILLAKAPEIAHTMSALNAQLAIYGKTEDVYDLPEHRGGADMNRPVEGFGGIPENPVTTISEKNVLRITEGPNQTRYLNECILVHEFAHAIHLIGINHLKDSQLKVELEAAYHHAREANLWPNTYAISNHEEYFATLTTIWFNVMAESIDGSWDGIRGPINRRSELEIYDPAAYNLLAKIYDNKGLPAPWQDTPNNYPYLLTS